jgi:hypothetical protein
MARSRGGVGIGLRTLQFDPAGAQLDGPIIVLRIAQLPSDTNRYFTESAFDPIAVVAGLIQTAIYADFGYIVSAKSPSPNMKQELIISSTSQSRLT